MSDSQSEEEGTKWTCEYCTYKNFRSAVRCTMCAGSKPLLNEDIFRLSPSSQPAALFSGPSIRIGRSKTPSPQPQQLQSATVPALKNPTTTATPTTTTTTTVVQQHPSDVLHATTTQLSSSSVTLASAPAALSPKLHSPHNSPSQDATDCSSCTSPKQCTPQCSSRIRPRSPTKAAAATALAVGTDDKTNIISTTSVTEALHNDMNDQMRAMSLRAISNAPTTTTQSELTTHPATAVAAVPNICDASTVGSINCGSNMTTSTTITTTNTTSPLGSASNLYGSRTNLGAASAVRISPVDGRLLLYKWACTLCTYENYPKSQKCSMCGHVKEQQQLSGSAAAAAAESSAALICRGPTLIPDDDDVDAAISTANAQNSSNSNVSVAAAALQPPATENISSSSGGDDGNNCASNYIIPTRVMSSPPPTQQHHHQHHQHQHRNNNNQHHHHNHHHHQQHNRYQLVAASGVAAIPSSASSDNNSGTVALLATGNNASAPMAAAAVGGTATAIMPPAILAPLQLPNNCDNLQERRFRHLRRQADWQWLNACIGVVDDNYAAVESYLTCGGNPGRTLTVTEVSLLNRSSAFDVGHTLIHLAIRFHRDEMLPMLLAQINGSGPGIKRVPSYVAPDLASDIRRHFANSLRCRKAAFPCQYITEHATFALPAEIEELPHTIQEQLHDELLDRDAQAQLECSPPALNWSLEITVRLGSRLMVLWNRSAGDCLLDSAMQATWGVFDRDNTLRHALADSLHQCEHIFYPRWKEYEMAQAALQHFALEEAQWEDDWATLLSLARQPGASLEQLHIFALAHILRRPIVVYGVKYVKSFRGEDIGFARFEGVYVPLLWDQSFCSKSPLALGYTRGHFSALVPVEPYTRIDAACVDSEDVLFLPLMDCEHKLLPIHFLTHAEMGREESIMRQWLDVCVTEGGLLVAQQKLQKRPLLVAQMLEEWLNHYRRIAQVIAGPYSRRRPHNHTGYSSDGDTDEE